MKYAGVPHAICGLSTQALPAIHCHRCPLPTFYASLLPTAGHFLKRPYLGPFVIRLRAFLFPTVVFKFGMGCSIALTRLAVNRAHTPAAR
jgi:hypothetical protein